MVSKRSDMALLLASMKQANPTVRTNFGTIEGVIEDCVCVVKGIPYGASVDGVWKIESVEIAEERRVL